MMGQARFYQSPGVQFMKMWNPDHSREMALTFHRGALFVLIVGISLGSMVRAQDARPAGPAPSGSTPAGTVPEVAPSDVPTAPIAASLDTMTALNDKSKLSNGDTVSYRVIEEQQAPILLTVSDSGELTIPLVGIITAKGKTCKQVAYELKPLLEKQYFYHATVIVGLETFSTHPLGKVYLMGQVQKQGAVEIPSNETLTVSQAILLVGGLADFADKRKVKLIRKMPDGTTQTTVVDLIEILEKGHTDRDPAVQPGDTINVPQRLINF
jgi:polysaccharide export outer membrane protein